ncbi:MAG: hypothetical protein NTX98_03760 [Candidatus Doudnabacteria bacterium]|nr:hypothetical protein [Candidatus Doudnabacteria bacterium]
MAHARVPNGGLLHAQGRLPAHLAFGRGSGLTTVMEQGMGKSYAVGARLGHNGNVRCPHCEKISHHKWGTGPHKCDQSHCGKEFKTRD